jgi:hypothetical protein
MPPVPTVEQGFSPLDEELALLPGALTPRMRESLVRLSNCTSSFGLSAYNRHPTEHRQLCWAHLKRNIRGIADRGDAPSAPP